MTLFDESNKQKSNISPCYIKSIYFIHVICGESLFKVTPVCVLWFDIEAKTQAPLRIETQFAKRDLRFILNLSLLYDRLSEQNLCVISFRFIQIHSMTTRESV